MNTMRVLVVDDEVLIVDMVADALMQEGMEVVAAYRAHDALVIASREHFSVAVLDLVLPDISGKVVLEKLCEKKVPVIVFTGFVDDKLKRELFQLGAEDYVTKPVDMKYLAQKVRMLAGRVSALVGSPPPQEGVAVQV